MAIAINTSPVCLKLQEWAKLKWEQAYANIPVNFPPIFKPRTDFVKWAKNEHKKRQR